MSKLYKKDKRLLYIKSFCAYIDILGFSEKIKQQDLKFFSKYLKMLDKELKYINQRHSSFHTKDKRFELKIFTDNFVFGHPWHDESGEVELGIIFDVLSHIQLTFAKSNIFIRGAISVSNLYMDENIVLGPAIVESYELETKKAQYPRIILSDDVVKIVKKHIKYYGNNKSAPQNMEYLIDIDGVYFINYLFILFFDTDYDDYSEDFIIKELNLHKDSVIQNLNQFKGNIKIFDKYSWVANYHNYFCDNFVLPRLPLIDIDKIKIDSNLYLKTITNIV